MECIWCLLTVVVVWSLLATVAIIFVQGGTRNTYQPPGRLDDSE